MKNRIITCLILLLSGTCTVKAQDLLVIDQDYVRAVKESKVQQKAIIIDFYTTWCGPCKLLDREIYQNPVLAKEIAKKFIVLKYDAEQDTTHQLSLKHHISSYPTTIMLNNEQRVVKKMYGFGGNEVDLVKNFRSFMADGLTDIAANRFVNGVSANTHQDYPQFYREYVYRTNFKDTDQKVNAYWENTDDYISEVPFAILSYFTGGTDKVDTYFLNNKSKYEALYGKTDVEFVVSMLIGKKIQAAISKKNREEYATAIQFAKENMKSAGLADYLEVCEERMLQAEQRWPEAIKMFAVRKAKPGFQQSSINNFCWSAFQNCKDEAVLKQCAQFMKELSDKSPAFDNLDTYARILHKIGDKTLAVTKMKAAIKIGKLNKEDTSESEEWLKKNQGI